MIRRSWRLLIALLVMLLLAAGIGYWWFNRPAPQPTVNALQLPDGNAVTQVIPGEPAEAQVAIAVPADQALNNTQLISLSQDANARIVQVILPNGDCKLQQKAFDSSLQYLDGAPTLVAGIGSGAELAWKWLAGQNNDQARAVSVGFNIDQQGCDVPLPKKAAHGHWTAAWNDRPGRPQCGLRA